MLVPLHLPTYYDLLTYRRAEQKGAAVRPERAPRAAHREQIRIGLQCVAVPGRGGNQVTRSAQLHIGAAAVRVVVFPSTNPTPTPTPNPNQLRLGLQLYG